MASAGKENTGLPVAVPEAAGHLRLADVLVDIFVDLGIRAFFGIPGGGISPIHDALLGRTDVNVVTSRHEAGAMFAAAGYARITGKPAVVLVTTGPGVLSAMNGLASASCEGLPIILLSGEIPRTRFGTGALQDGSSYELDIIGMARSITKFAMQLREPRMGISSLRAAIQIAQAAPKGPVLLTLPVDVAVSPVEVGHVSISAPPTEMRSPLPLAAVVAETLQKSIRPVILVGAGAKWQRGAKLVRELAERLQIPVMTTPKAKGVFPEAHPLSLGVFGFGGHPSTETFLADKPDTLLVLGSGLGEVATNGFSPLLAPRHNLIHVDPDPLQIGRIYSTKFSLVATIEEAVPQILEHLPLGSRPSEQHYGIERYEDASLPVDGPSGFITPHRALWELQTLLPKDAIFTCDIGEHLLFAIHYLQIEKPDQFCIMTGLGSMGSGIGAAIGIKLARRNRFVVAICGDGCFAMGLGDIATAASERLSILVVVLNDERYGMVEMGHESVYGRRPPYPTGPMNISEVAKGLGAEAMKIHHAGDFLRLHQPMMDALQRGPLVLDVRIDASTRMPKNRRNAVIANNSKRLFN